MTSRPAAPSVADDDDVCRAFLRYQAPRLVSASSQGDADELDLEGVAPASSSTRAEKASAVAGHVKKSPIPVARLAAAKDAARDAFLAAHGAQPTPLRESGAAEPTAAARASMKASTRKDPVHRLPTPPSMAGKSHSNVRGTGRLSGTTTGDAPSASHVLQSVMTHVRRTAPLLNAMFPPVPATPSEPSSSTAAAPMTVTPESAQGGARWMRFVSTEPATRDDVVVMHAQLRQRLQERRARASGLCPVRRAIYEDVFDELLRQVAVEEPARGVLLQRLREDLRGSLRLHQDLCNRAHLFCSTRCLEAHDDEALAQMAARVASLEAARDELHAAQHALTVRLTSIESRFDRERAARNKKQQEELAYLRRANQQLSLRLKLETEKVTANGNTGRFNAPEVSVE